MTMLTRRRGRTEITPLSPLREFQDLYDRLDRLISATMGEMMLPRETETPWMPFADVCETEDSFVVEADLPGVTKDQIDVQLSDRELIISGEVKEEERDARMHRRTRRTGEFEFRTMLPGEIDPERVDAKLRDGVLTVTIPKAQTARPRHIEVSA
ncbi:MAG: Hsp20/alpha crystallin family protein [Actinomycetes bacterium]|nr:MAG: heat-shock protein Hsp20 [Actinomycetota bacterium]